jgi:CHAT domain-containing protein
MRPVRVFVGRTATERQVRRALTEYDVVHLATHGIMNVRSPMFSRMRLAPGRGSVDDDGWLEVHDLLGMRIESDLVFLSGCETGTGPAWTTRFNRGEDYATLARAFLYAGAHSVVATLWPITDDGAAAFARAFYAALAQAGPAEALAGAQRALARDPRFKSPFYWAAYQLVGEGGQ